MIQDPDKMPPEFDYESVRGAKPVELGTVAQGKYKALFDVTDQHKVFCRQVQHFLRGLCETLLSVYPVDRESRLDLSAFDPQAMFSRSKDPVVDSFMNCCLVLRRFGLLADGLGVVVLQQVNGVSNSFLHCSQNQSSDCPVVGDVLNLWLSYPHWSRCRAFLMSFKLLTAANSDVRIVRISWM